MEKKYSDCDFAYPNIGGVLKLVKIAPIKIMHASFDLLGTFLFCTAQGCHIMINLSFGLLALILAQFSWQQRIAQVNT